MLKKSSYYEEGGDKLIEEFEKVLNYFESNLDFSKIADFGLRYLNVIEKNVLDLLESDLSFFKDKYPDLQGTNALESNRVMLLENSEVKFKVSVMPPVNQVKSKGAN